MTTSISPGRHAAAAPDHGPSAVGWVGQLVVWTALLGLAAVLAVAVVIPRIVGATPYTVLTGSMSPTYPPGTLVVVRPTPPDDIAVGDVITYQLDSGRPTVVTHRVVAVGASTSSGERVFTTRGDANGADDAERVRPVQVRGTVWYGVPHLGRANQVLTGDQRQAAVNATAAALIGYALWTFVAGRRENGVNDRGTAS